MSSSQIKHLKFPSGRSVQQIKKDAKSYANQHHCSINEALNALCIKNGINAQYPQAIEQLKRSYRPPIKPADNAANMQNANKGAPGTNLQYDQNQGNRGKQLNTNNKQHFVTFRTVKSLLTEEFLKEHKLRRLTKKDIELLLANDRLKDFYFSSYDYIQFQKPIKGGTDNISGALQRIHSVMTGKLKWKQSPSYWIDSICHTDKKHPDELYEPLEYCPAIDGY